MNARATFVRMQDSTREDWQLIGGEFMQFATGLPERVIKHLQILEGDYGGFPIDRYTHSLQTAVIDRDGRLAATVEGKDFTPRQLGDLIGAVLDK